ncbi:MAG: GreA/GreB family elongation factor [Chloroflexota bacterium]
MEEQRFTLTLQGYKRLKTELDTLLDEQRERQAQMQALYQDADGKNEEEAAEFDVRTMKERVDERVGHLQFVLERAVVLDEDPDPKRINAGDRVIVWDLGAHKERTFNLVSGEEIGTVENAVATDSLVGQALLGQTIGDMVEVEVPDGWGRYAIRRLERVGE